MFGLPEKVAVASAAAVMFLTAPAAAGGYYTAGAYAGCNCLAAAPAVYGVPVTYYAAASMYVPTEVYVRQQAFVPVRSYIVDRGPSFDVPAVPYTAPSVSYPSGYYYPYVPGRRVVYGGYRHRRLHYDYRPFHHDWRMPRRAIRYGAHWRGGRHYLGHRHGRGHRHRHHPLSYK